MPNAAQPEITFEIYKGPYTFTYTINGGTSINISTTE
jgi:hypothetical protein